MILISNVRRSSNISFKENKPGSVDLNLNGVDYCVRKNEEKIPYGFRETTVMIIIVIID